MPRKSKKPVRKQTHSPTGKVVGQVGQILLPMIAGIAATKADLTEWVYEQGLTALHLLLREDAEKIAGPKGKHEKERTHNHWGSTPVLPRQVWINPPPEKTTPQEALGATFSGRPIPELPPDSSYPDAIASEPNRDRTALTPRLSLIEAH